MLAAHDNERLWVGVVGDGGSLWKMRIRSEISLPAWSFTAIEIGELRTLLLLINESSVMVLSEMVHLPTRSRWLWLDLLWSQSSSALHIL